MPKRSSKKDFSQIAFSIVEKATNDSPPSKLVDVLNDAETRKRIMQEIGRMGGKKGGAARANSMTPERRSEIAKVAAAKRWSASALKHTDGDENKTETRKKPRKIKASRA